MNLVHQLLAQRGVRKLKGAGALTPVALKQLKDDLVGLGASAVAPLTTCLRDAVARGPALEVLEQLLSDQTLELYIDALSEPDPAVVSGVSRVLATSHRYDPAKLLPLLSDPSVSKSVLEHILHEQGAALPLDKLLFVLPNLGRDGQIVVFRLVEKRADPSAVPSLLPLLAHPDHQVRQSTIKLLSRFVDESVVNGLRKVTLDPVAHVRLEAVQALQRLRATSAVPELARALRDTDFKVQAAAIDALCEIGDAKAVPQLLAVLTDPSDQARRAAVEVLNVVATPEAIADLVRALGDQDWWVRVRAADALGALGGEKVVQAVVGLMDSTDEFLRRQAVEILNAVPTQAAALALIHALEDEDWWVRERAIDALGKTRDTRAVEPLLKLLEQHERTAPLCAKAVAAIGDPRAVAPVIRLYETGPAELRAETLEALKAFRDADLGPSERALLREALAKVPSENGPMIAAMPATPAGGFDVMPATSRTPMPMPSLSRPPTPRPMSAPPTTPVASPTPRPPARERTPAPGTILNYGELPAGTLLLERYRVVKKIGRGGFGVVYLVEDSAIEDQVILKILHPQLSADETMAQRFVQELKLTRRITHKNVIRIHDFLDLGGAHAVSMEYFAGTDMGAMLEQGGAMPVGRALPILVQVCEGLGAAHAQGVIHRDIKPGNLLVGERDLTKILDFGLASTPDLAGSRLTKSGILIGSPEYMAPEQISGEKIDHRADLYSLGVVMYELFSGTKPFVAETPVKVLFQHLEGAAEPLARRVSGLPGGLSNLVMAVMSKDPNGRPPSADALRMRLEREISLLGGGS
ncbi:MAG TPA: HEAT repeat domain-containing protein [Candidatus Eisenbacteria bacterium]|nr:HEAT repeat domain-containing protein [Candidatus Eisenbacteria bacterium]